MPLADDTNPAPAARSIEAGVLLVGAGAILLFVSLFLEWYQPGIDAWTVFEAWDLVLAALAVVAVVAAAGRMGFGPPRPSSWLLGAALAALVIVLYAILDPPPAINGIADGDPGTGLWLALAASVLMTAGAVLAIARIAVAFTVAEPVVRAPADPAAPRRSGRRFVRDAGALPGDESAASVAPTEPTRRI